MSVLSERRSPESPQVPSVVRPSELAFIGAETDFFVGRDRELFMLAQSLEVPGALVTVVGLAGMGKTALVRQYLRGSGGKGVRVIFCDLVAVRSISDLCGQLCALLGVAKEPRALGDALSRTKGVVVLDGAEHLASELPSMLAQWREQGPGVCWLVTSRVRLQLADELVTELPPLVVPPARTLDLEGVLASEAGRLFVHAMGRIHAEARPAADDASTIASIVRQLDGHPLAIELAVSRLEVLSLTQLEKMLDHRLDVLVQLGQTGRHQSVRHTLEESWALLDVEDKRSMTHLSVFRGGFSLSSVLSVLDLENEARAAEVLQRLRSKCLIQATEPTADGSPRFDMARTVIAFAQQQLDVDGCIAVQERHTAWFAARCEEGVVRVHSRHRGETLRWVAQETENLCAVWDRLEAQKPTTPPQLGQVLSLVAVLAATRVTQGCNSKLLARMERVVASAVTGCAQPKPALCALLFLMRLRAVDDDSVSNDAFKRLLGQIDLDDDPEFGVIVLFNRLGYVADRLDYEAALTTADELRSCLHVPDHSILLTLTEMCLAYVAGVTENIERFKHHELRVMMLARGSNFEPLIGYLNAIRVGVLSTTGDRVAARSAGMHALSQIDDVSDSVAMIRVLCNLSTIELGESGDVCAAAAWLRRGRTVCETSGGQMLLPSVNFREGLLAMFEQRWLDAFALFDDAVHLAVPMCLGFERPLYFATRAVTRGALGDFPGADEDMHVAETLMADSRVPSMRLAVQLYMAHLLVLRAARETHHETAQSLRRKARDIAAATRRSPLSSRSWPRLAAATLDRVIGASPNAGRGTTPTLRIGEGVQWFAAPGQQERVCLARRKLLRRLLDGLVRSHQRFPGRTVTRHDLVQMGWPRERISVHAARNRLNVALTTLRNLGLRGVLVTTAEGYHLDVSVEVVEELEVG